MPAILPVLYIHLEQQISELGFLVVLHVDIGNVHYK